MGKPQDGRIEKGTKLNWTEEQLKEVLKKNPDLKCREHIAYLGKMKGVILKPTIKGGWREDLQRYFRSSWEANYARYLNFIKEPWEYEVQEWEFPVKRGTRFYKCDFYIPARNEYHEVKGYMDKQSRTKLNRMKKHYPDIKIVIIGAEEYKEIAKFKELITGWEG